MTNRLAQLEAVGEEPTFIQSVLPEHLENVDFTFFASDENFTRRSWQMARKAGSDIIDLSYALENEKGVLLRAPWIERELNIPPEGGFRGGAGDHRASRRGGAGPADASCQKRLAASRAPSPRRLSPLPSTASAAWTNCMSRP